MAYVYRGTRTIDTEHEPVEPVKAGRVFDQAKCGTNAGYKQHQNTGTTPCQPCKDATAACRREQRARLAERKVAA